MFSDIISSIFVRHHSSLFATTIEFSVKNVRTNLGTAYPCSGSVWCTSMKSVEEQSSIAQWTTVPIRVIWRYLRVLEIEYVIQQKFETTESSLVRLPIISFSISDRENTYYVKKLQQGSFEGPNNVPVLLFVLPVCRIRQRDTLRGTE